ncbi:hypothetical protein [Ectobacillus ponti]|uniref:Uncharacterized protein n=1 Tax=Ectobacillus ponti TaxID=2961894 RepID=A0AA42BNQ3_9BACI|nr:hypothetical protein [Ectobacillus ponti]MCP8967932.1 hypothetical protein [Ectobacillus ponti]
MRSIYGLKSIAIAASVLMLWGCAKEEPKEGKPTNAQASVKQGKQDDLLKDTQKVGTPEYGYVYVPKDWAHFKDVDGNNSLQMSKGDGSQILSLNIVKGPETASLQDYANSLAKGMEGKGITDIKGAKTKIKQYDALQLYGTYKNGANYLIVWVFKPEDGKAHYIALEGPKDQIMQQVRLIEEGGWFSS